jgi:intracellular sulfur oxidation DsrE/DsrF family protein
MEGVMKILWTGAVVVFAALFGLSGRALAQSAQTLPIAGVEAATNVPGAHELPDPNLTYKIAFDLGKASPKIDDVNPGLIKIAQFFNTLASNGVPADHRKIVVVFHQGGTDLVLNNAAYKARNDGHDNPNIALLQNMKKAGIDLRVCGQGVVARKIDAAAILPEVQVDLWAMTTFTTLQLRGYVRVSGN